MAVLQQEDLVFLIENIRDNHTCLYDYDHPDFWSKNIKTQIFIELRQTLMEERNVDITGNFT